MFRFALFLIACFFFGSIGAQSAEDEAFRKIMEDYKQKLQAVKTREQGLKLMNEIKAKQQAYLNKKMDTATKIKNAYGTDQIGSAMTAMANATGAKKYVNNPLFVKCKVEVSFTNNSTNATNNGAMKTRSESHQTGSGTIRMTTYMFKYMGRIVITGDTDAIVQSTAGGATSQSGSDQSPSGSSSYNGNGSAVNTPKPAVNFSFEGPDRWSVQATVHYKGQRTDKRGSVPNDFDDGSDADADNGRLVQSGNSFTITRNISEHNTKVDGDNKQTEEKQGTLSVKITPDNGDTYLAYFEPVAGQQAYEQWMPEGYGSHASEHGNYIDIKLKVESKAHPGEDFTNQIKYIKWELPADEVGHVPGYANNAPSETLKEFAHPNPHNPISLLADMQLHITTDLSDTSVENLAITSTVANNYTVRVYAFDWGAFAKLTAHVVLTDSTEIIAMERATGNEFLLLPKRDGDSKVATYYKKSNKVNDRKDTDDDEKMSGDDKYPGDGFTLYEEYRGFMEHGKHFRGDPKAKDVMIYDGINTGRTKDGIAMYELVLNNYTLHVVKTHHRFTEKEFGLEQGYFEVPQTEITASNKYGINLPFRTKCLNFNNIPELHAVDQHGICILGTPKELGFAFASANVGGDCGPPKNFDFLVISADFSPDPKGYATIKVDLDSLGNITVNPNGKSLVTTDEYAVTVAHEMLHNSGVSHHGDNTDYDKPCTFEYIGHNNWKINGNKVVQLFWENAPTVPIDTMTDRNLIRKLHENGEKLTIRTWHGVCSGFEDCIMRYDDASGYSKTKASNQVYMIPSRHNYRELTGIHLCTSATGTGVNAAGHLPMSRYSDADAGYGNCIHQFCVNDKYAH
ncbi:MAG: hypothetical protein ABIX01_01185 [Chitinophagaceae bacterium]